MHWLWELPLPHKQLYQQSSQIKDQSKTIRNNVFILFRIHLAIDNFWPRPGWSLQVFRNHSWWCGESAATGQEIQVLPGWQHGSLCTATQRMCSYWSVTYFMLSLISHQWHSYLHPGDILCQAFNFILYHSPNPFVVIQCYSLSYIYIYIY